MYTFNVYIKLTKKVSVDKQHRNNLVVPYYYTPTYKKKYVFTFIY